MRYLESTLSPRGLFWAASLVLMASVSARPATQKLIGTVTDDSGGAIADAQILVRWDKSGAAVGLSTNVGLPNDLSLRSNKEGQFDAELPPCFYDVFISATAFSPECRKVRVKPGQTTRYHARLKTDPLVIKELGDPIAVPR
jgi:hypothetical protein